MSDRKYEAVNSPFGEAVYPHLNRPDTRFNEFGIYSVSIALDEGSEEAVRFIKKLEGIRDEYFNSLPGKVQGTHNKKDVYDVEYTEEGVPTGRILFKFKQKAKHVMKDGTEIEFDVKLFDRYGKPLTETIWNKSILSARAEVAPYAMGTSKEVGVSLRLRAVMVRELVTGTGGPSAESLGWEVEEAPEEEGGWEEA